MSNVATVLVVEDDPESRSLLESWLRWMGHSVLSAASVDDARSVVRDVAADPTRHVDLAVLDIVLPDGTGLEVLEHLRQQVSTSHIPAIFLTASESGSDRASARALEGHFVSKPITRSVLQAAVEAALI